MSQSKTKQTINEIQKHTRQLVRELDAIKAVDLLADDQIESSIELLSAEQQAKVIEGLKLYGKALRMSRLQSEHQIRKIQQADNAQMARVLREVLTEFGCVGEGYSINDPEVDEMHGNYQGEQFCYYVIVKDNKVVGGGGIAPLIGGDANVCELRKMFFQPQARGFGLGRKLLSQLLDEARERGFKKCYLETLERMDSAKALYKRFGFERLKKPKGNTGHCSCDCWFELKL